MHLNSCDWCYLLGILIWMIGVVILLLMHHFMTWVFILSIQTMTANYTRIRRQSSVTIAIRASKYLLWPYSFIHSPFHHRLIVWSFRAGVAQYMKTEWRLVAIFNVVLFVILVRHFLLALTDLFNSLSLFLNSLVPFAADHLLSWMLRETKSCK